MTREEWLEQLIAELRPRYDGELPETIHVSVSFPSSGIRSKTIGQCWHGPASEDGFPHILIHPKMSDAVEVAAVVVHELVHAARPEAKHGKAFKQMAESLGLQGKMTATTASDALKVRLREIIGRIGEYPHPALSGQGPTKKQTTRMLKVQCPICDYTVRTSAKWLEVGLPMCPDGDTMIPEDGETGEGK